MCVFSKFRLRVGSPAVSAVAKTLISHSFWLEEEKDFRKTHPLGSKGKKEIKRGGAPDSLYKFFLTLQLNLEPPKHEAVKKKKMPSHDLGRR